MIKAVFFDLFFTLITPHYLGENEVIGISTAEWESYAEKENLYVERALGKVRSEMEIVQKIVDEMPYQITLPQIQEILDKRMSRMKRALCFVDEIILNTLEQLRKTDIKICLISNADFIDCKYWELSPLAKYFDCHVFSCEVGYMKPDDKIYQYAMNRLQVLPSESLFVGDGGSNELYGAKKAGMYTAFSEYLEKKPKEKRSKILQYTDYQITEFKSLLNIIKYANEEKPNT